VTIREQARKRKWINEPLKRPSSLQY